MSICPNCGCEMKHRDYVKRVIKMGGGRKKWIDIEREYCPYCKTVRRKLPPNLDRFKQYDSNIIQYAKTNADAFSWDLEYENYPCDETIRRWNSQ